MAMATTRQVAEELRTKGRFDTLAPAFAQADAQRLFADLSQDRSQDAERWSLTDVASQSSVQRITR